MVTGHWLDWISSYHDKSIELSLARMQVIASSLKFTKFACPVITVAGTNGKGSTVATMEALLLASGKRVGAYTSPHFFRFNERIRINGTHVAEDSCAQAFDFIHAAAATAHAQEFSQLTFFEYATLIALKLFKDAQLDVILLEVGLGGRLDAVNVVENDLSIITSIGLDHTEYLGNSLTEIALEKAGVIKSQSYFVCGDQLASTQDLLRQAALLKGAKAQFIGTDFKMDCKPKVWQYAAADLQLDNLPYNSFPSQNMACALRALRCLQLLPVSALNAPWIAKVLAAIKVPGRFQMFTTSSGCEVIFDVAHNPPAAAWLAEQLKQLPPRQTKAIIGIAASKDCDGVIAPYANLIDAWYPVSIGDNKNAVSNQKHFVAADILAKRLVHFGHRQITTCTDVSQAFQLCLEHSNARDRVIVFGSFVTVAKGFDAMLSYNERG